MTRLERLINVKLTGWSKVYKTKEGAETSANCWISDCTIHSEIRKTFSVRYTEVSKPL